MSKSHVVIAGTGRAGTTFLVQLLTELGLDTGFSKEDYPSKIDPESHGGLEFDLGTADYQPLPRILKSPYFYKVADKVLNEKRIEIEHVLIPVRNLEHAAKSRIRVQSKSDRVNEKIEGGGVPGGLVGTNKPELQEIILGRQLSLLLMAVSKSFTPHSILAFPTMILDPEYLFKSIKFLIPGTTFESFNEKFQEIVNVDYLHDFSNDNSHVNSDQEMNSFLNKISHDQYLFGVDDYMSSAWIGHAPFMKFIIRELKPKIFVELGVHNGFSYFVGCQAIKECGLSAKAFAIDHWEGDSQAGFFDDSVFQGVLQVNSKYSGFSTLLKSSFSNALKSFENESIDLLHIDGYHSYGSVKEDFETWLPKVSENGVILLHDIHVRRNTFGVYEFWKEVKENYRTMEFVGSHGLGVVFLGKIPEGRISKLFEISKSGNQAQIHGTFGSISDDVIQTFRSRTSAIAERDSAIAERDSAIAERDSAIAERDSAIAERDSAIAERDSAIAERESVLNSKIWRLSKPYRIFRSKF
jgi:hypothetical protein